MSRQRNERSYKAWQRKRPRAEASEAFSEGRAVDLWLGKRVHKRSAIDINRALVEVQEMESGGEREAGGVSGDHRIYEKWRRLQMIPHEFQSVLRHRQLGPL